LLRSWCSTFVLKSILLHEKCDRAAQQPEAIRQAEVEAILAEFL